MTEDKRVFVNGGFHPQKIGQACVTHLEIDWRANKPRAI